MLRRLAAAIAIAVALLLVAVLEISFLTPLEGAICNKADNPSGEKCAVFNLAFVLFWKIGEFFNYYSPAITALATAAIAAFTLTLWRATTEHGRITDAVLQLARDEFNASHRPRLRVRYFNVFNIVDEQIMIQFTIVNVGGSNATLISSLGRAEFFFLDRQRPHQGGSTMIEAPSDFAPGAVRRGSILFKKQSPDVIAAMSRKGQALHAYGHISYVDPIENVRTTAFCRRYTVGRERFEIVTDPDYEYED